MPNAFYSFPSDSQKARVHIIKETRAGEEITRDYGTDSEVNRHEWLQKQHRVTCENCPIYTSARRLTHEMHSGYYWLIFPNPTERSLKIWPLRWFTLIGLQTTMLLRDNIVDGRLSKVIEEAFLITAGQKDAAESQNFCRMAYAATDHLLRKRQSRGTKGKTEAYTSQ